MKVATKCVLSCFLGVGIGAGGMYIFLKKKMEKMYYEELRKAIDEECSNIRKFNAEKLTPLGPTSDPVREQDAEESEEKSKDYVDYTSFFQQAQVSEDDSGLVFLDEDPEDDDDPDAGKIFEDRDPYIITGEDFVNLPPRYEFYTWGYFARDQTFVDDTEEPIDNPYIYVGNLFDDEKVFKGKKYVYVIAERQGCAMEIEIFDSAYGEYIGIS